MVLVRCDHPLIKPASRRALTDADVARCRDCNGTGYRQSDGEVRGQIAFDEAVNDIETVSTTKV